jgi:hypothetical protein
MSTIYKSIRGWFRTWYWKLVEWSHRNSEAEVTIQNPHEFDRAIQAALLNHPAIKQNEWKTVAICAILVAAIGWAAFGWLMVLEAGR